MIEKYLQPGVRLKWSRPRSGMANPMGALKPSATLASRMTYDGLDGTIKNLQFMMTNVSQLDFRMGMQIDHDWLEYLPGFTTHMTLIKDTLTGPMSGCLIAVFQGATGRNVAHLGTVSERPVMNLDLKSNFRRSITGSVTAFSPASVWDRHEPEILANKVKAQGGTIIGLVTSTGAFYSVMILTNVAGKDGDCCIGGIKRVQPMTPSQLDTYLSTTVA